VANGLDVVAVGVEHKGPVIVGVIMRPEAGRSVVLAASGNRGGIERIDLCAARSGERDMDVPAA
jgi:hypothetical protein